MVRIDQPGRRDHDRATDKDRGNRWQRRFRGLTRRVVQSFTTEGYAHTKHPLRQGYRITFSNAFASAVEGVAENKNFQKIIRRESEEDSPVYERLVLRGPRHF
jgi:hypothetical protein